MPANRGIPCICHAKFCRAGTLGLTYAVLRPAWVAAKLNKLLFSADRSIERTEPDLWNFENTGRDTGLRVPCLSKDVLYHTAWRGEHATPTPAREAHTYWSGYR
jgi:hypothetical protein